MGARGWPLLWLLVAACGWGTQDPAERRAERRQRMMQALQRRQAAPMPEGSPRVVPDEIADGPTVDALPEGQPALVALFVLDTVRADRLSACGHDRPTSPNLARMAEQATAFTCDAHTPATWTIPSHATFFTGELPHEHGMIRKGLRLDEATPTLAEHFASQGYQTVFLSANPVIHEATGLHRGFHRARNAPGLVSAFRGEGLVTLLRQELAGLDPSRPLFLVVNIFDAHDPYPAIPAGHPFLPEQGPVLFRPSVRELSNPAFAFFKGALSEEKEAAWIRSVRDGYDLGVQQADEQLGRLSRVLNRQGWTDHGARIVVTSDHGEHLGHKHMLRHDGPPWEAVTRVPFLYWDTTRGEGAEPFPIPSPFPAAATYTLLKDGRLPDDVAEPFTATSVAYGIPDPTSRYVDATAAWGPDGHKVLRLGADLRAYDLTADPTEDRPLDAVPAPLQAVADAAHVANAATKEAAGLLPQDADLVELLEEMGYVEVDPGE